jgi:hypothetical protein
MVGEKLSKRLNKLPDTESRTSSQRKELLGSGVGSNGGRHRYVEELSHQ